jgi:hypothetical protein
MTAKTDFEPQEWDLISEAPPGAAFLVITSERGGTLRETLALANEYAHVRAQHGHSELLDELVSSRPHIDHTRYHSPEELREAVLAHLREAMAALRAKAQPQEVEDYKSFVVSLSEHVAGAHAEHGTGVSEAERGAIEAIQAAVG